MVEPWTPVAICRSDRRRTRGPQIAAPHTPPADRGRAVILGLDVLIDAVSITLVLALAAFGLAIIFGLIGVINLGHGAMLTLGAYFTWACTSAGCLSWSRWSSRRSASA